MGFDCSYLVFRGASPSRREIVELLKVARPDPGPGTLAMRLAALTGSNRDVHVLALYEGPLRTLGGEPRVSSLEVPAAALEHDPTVGPPHGAPPSLGPQVDEDGLDEEHHAAGIVLSRRYGSALWVTSCLDHDTEHDLVVVARGGKYLETEHVVASDEFGDYEVLL